VDLFIRTRRTPPAEAIRDADASDDPVHGHQALSGYHGHYRQPQYLPLFVYDGASGFPLAAGLRPGAVHASLGVAEGRDRSVTQLRAAGPGVRRRVRSDNGRAVPGLSDYGAAKGLPEAFGDASNPLRQRATAPALADREPSHASYGHREPVVQRFEALTGYQAESWPQPRRIVATIAGTPPGGQRRFVAADQDDPPEAGYRDFDVQRGRVPQQPIGEMKHGRRAERRAAGGLWANAFRLLGHALAYAIVVPFREAAAAVPAVATAPVSRLRPRPWKGGAVGVTGVRRIWFHVSQTWPGRVVWGRVLAAVGTFVGRWPGHRPRRGACPGKGPPPPPAARAAARVRRPRRGAKKAGPTAATQLSGARPWRPDADWR
jgi:hypothetical protein